jgi:transcription elongation factor GreA
MNITTTNKQPVLLSKKGMRDIKKKISQLDHDRHALIHGLKEMSKTNNHDDRLERVERLASLENIENELAEYRQLLSDAKLLPTRRARLKVAIGSVVDLIDQQGRLVRYTLVDSIEADPSEGKISVVSPLGRNLVGKTVKDIVLWTNSLGTQSMRLVNIR